jgi:hypothetical protein
MIRTLEELDSNERSLLLFLETCAVDYGGKVKTACMNKEDMVIAEGWNKEKFISFNRIKFADIKPKRFPLTYFVQLSDNAWELAHQERRARCERIKNKLKIELVGVEK